MYTRIPTAGIPHLTICSYKIFMYIFIGEKTAMCILLKDQITHLASTLDSIQRKHLSVSIQPEEAEETLLGCDYSSQSNPQDRSYNFERGSEQWSQSSAVTA